MYSLFISTYNENILIGLYKDQKLVLKKSKITLKSHSIYLVPLIKEVLEEAKITTKELSEIIVVNGPGSFTGIRLGITVAKMLAYTLKITLKQITSIEAISYSIPEKNKIVSISDSKGKYFGVFKNNILVDEISYLKNDLFDQYIKDIEYKEYCNLEIGLASLEGVFENMLTINPHESKPIYIKEIEALSDK